MLTPDNRKLYLDAVRPPAGYELGFAVGTTYTLDLDALLAVPLAVSLGTIDARKLGRESSVALLEAVRRTAGRMAVFCHAGRMGVPAGQHVLYGLLERTLVEVRAPEGGAFHPKIWAFRYEPVDVDGPELVRLLVLSRNITHDRCWDVSLCVEGELGRQNVGANRPIGELIAALPDLALQPARAELAQEVRRLAEEVRRTRFEVPAPWEDLQFHTLGLSAKPKHWLPLDSKRLAVISPFLAAGALTQLADTTEAFVALLARQDELDALPTGALDAVEQAYVLHEATESEDGEETPEDGRALAATSLRGLHAKAYVAEIGRETHLYVGSANASNHALLLGRNIEVMAELTGKTKQVGGIDALLGSDGMLPLLVPYRAPKAPVVPTEEEAAAEKALENAEIILPTVGIRVGFEAGTQGYVPVLVAPGPFALPGIASIKAWLVTVPEASASDCGPLLSAQPVSLPGCASESTTGLVAFEVTAEAMDDKKKRFVLNLPADGLPTDREAQIIRLVINNRERFLAYLLALLDDRDLGTTAIEPPQRSGGSTARGWTASGVLEQLVRARARAPERLREIQSVVDALASTPEGTQILPPDFLQVWTLLRGES